VRSYIPFTENTFWALRFDYETLDSWKNDSSEGVPVTERIFLGGNQNVRGYDFRDIAVYEELDQCIDNPGNFPQIPADQLVRCSGGNTAFFANLEYRLEAITNTMQLFAFADIGNVYRDSFELGFSDTKKSAGIGMRVRSPMGPINISWANRLEPTFQDVRHVEGQHVTQAVVLTQDAVALETGEEPLGRPVLLELGEEVPGLATVVAQLGLGAPELLLVLQPVATDQGTLLGDPAALEGVVRRLVELRVRA
jgi:hypothetical protein